MLLRTLLLVGSARALVRLNSDNFYSTINTDKYVMVHYASSSSEASVQIGHHFEFASRQLDESPLFEFATVDCQADAALCAQLPYLPQIVVYRDGQGHAYEGEHTKTAFLHHLERQALPSAVHVKDVSLKHLQALSFPVAVVHVSSQEQVEVLERVGEAVPDVIVAYDMDASDQPSIDMDGHTQVLDYDAFTAFRIQQHIATHQFPTVGELTMFNMGQYMRSPLPLAFLFVDEHEHALLSVLEEAVPLTRGKYNLAWAPSSKSDYILSTLHRLMQHTQAIDIHRQAMALNLLVHVRALTLPMLQAVLDLHATNQKPRVEGEHDEL